MQVKLLNDFKTRTTDRYHISCNFSFQQKIHDSKLTVICESVSEARRQISVSRDQTDIWQQVQKETILYIYLIQGMIDATHEPRHSSYLGTWVEQGFSYLFFLEPCELLIKELLSRSVELRFVDLQVLSYGQWQDYPGVPSSFGQWTVFSSRDELFDPANPDHIYLHPGLVFGSGMHPTTSTCLEQIQRISGNDLVRSMVDIGTGTGILAIGAAKWGVKRIVGIDNVLLSARTACRNVIMNRLEDQIMIIQGDARKLPVAGADLLVANIHYSILQPLITPDLCNQYRWFVFSGIAADEAGELIAHLKKLPFEITFEHVSDNYWLTIAGETRY